MQKSNILLQPPGGTLTSAVFFNQASSLNQHQQKQYSLPTCSIYSILLFEIVLILFDTVLILQIPSGNSKELTK